MKPVLIALMVACGLQAQAQSHFDDIAVDQVVSSSVSLGRFVKPLPLPEGHWQVIGKQVLDYKLLDGKVVPFHILSFKNSEANATQAGLILAYIPKSSIKISWLKEPCVASNPQVLVDQLADLNTDFTDLCALTIPADIWSGLAPQGEADNLNFYKYILPEIRAHAKNFARPSVLVSLMGSRFLDKKVFYNFVIRSEANFQTDEAYRRQLAAWTRSAGQTVQQILDGADAAFGMPPRGELRVIPKPPASQAAIPRPRTEPAPPPPNPNPVINTPPTPKTEKPDATPPKPAEPEEKPQTKKTKEELERQTRLEQVMALIGAPVQFQETFKHCLADTPGSPCKPVTYTFTVRGRILQINTRIKDEIRVEITDVLPNPATDKPAPTADTSAAEAAFKKKFLGTALWRSKTALGIVF